MPTYLPFSTQICYRDGLDASGYLSWFFFNLPITFWIMLAGEAFWSNDAYIQVLSSSYWLQLGVTVIIQEFTHQPPPNPSCNNQGFNLPSWQAQLAWAYIVMMCIHLLVFCKRIGFFDVIRGLLLGIIVPVVITVSGNSTPLQTFWGCLVGGVLSAFVMTWVTIFLLPRIQFVTQKELIFNIWGFGSGSRGFYRTDNIRDEELEKIEDEVYQAYNATSDMLKAKAAALDNALDNALEPESGRSLFTNKGIAYFSRKGKLPIAAYKPSQFNT